MYVLQSYLVEPAIVRFESNSFQKFVAASAHVISTFAAGSQAVRVNQPQASACAEEKLLPVSMSDVELKSGN